MKKRNKLSVKQKKMLAKLVEVLMPEYQPIHFDRNTDERMICMFLKSNDSDRLDDCNMYVHWMELCVYHLADKMADLSSKNNPYQYNEDDLKDGFMHDMAARCFVMFENPVTYLYKAYKRETS